MREVATANVTNHVARRVGPDVQRRIDALKIGQKMQDLPEELWHASFRYYVKEDPNRQGGPNLRMIRLDPNRPSLTVTGYIFNKFVHPYEDRYVTVREAARLQGFPDTVAFEGGLGSTQLQVGNAVPVPLARAVFNTILNHAARNDTPEPLTAFSLFSGAGGMDIGADTANADGLTLRTLVSLDNWADACRTLRRYHGDMCAVLERDITTIPNAKHVWGVHGSDCPPDVVYGGPPCQSFSQAGKQRGAEDDRGQMIFAFLQFVEQLQPRYFVLENVSNLRGVGGGTLYRDVLSRIAALRYHVSVGLLSAADFGTPQLRQRVIFLGTRADVGSVPLPEPTHRPFATLFGSPPYVTVGEAFAGLPQASFSNGRSIPQEGTTLRSVTAQEETA